LLLNKVGYDTGPRPRRQPGAFPFSEYKIGQALSGRFPKNEERGALWKLPHLMEIENRRPSALSLDDFHKVLGKASAKNAPAFPQLLTAPTTASPSKKRETKHNISITPSSGGGPNGFRKAPEPGQANCIWRRRSRIEGRLDGRRISQMPND